MGVVDWIKGIARIGDGVPPAPPEMGMQAQALTINPTPNATAARNAARLGRLFAAVASSTEPDKLALSDEITLLHAKLTVAGYRAPLNEAEAVALSKQLGG